MATSVPAARGRTQMDFQRSASLPVTLSYPGKRSVETIRATPAARTVPMWTPSSNPATARHNRLYYGDNLSLLAALRNDPEVCGHVRLIYIDPPYASGGAFVSRAQEHAYADTLTGADYVEALRTRLVLLYDLLAPNGSIYVHLDDYAAWTIKIVMDEVFGPQNYRNWITRKKCNPKNYTRNAYGNVSDFILFYTKSDTYVWHRPLEQWTAERRDKEYQFVDEHGRRHKRVPLHAPGVRHGATGEPWRGMLPPPGKHWQYLPSTLDDMDARGDIYWSKNGNPRRKVYFDDSEGVAVQDIWLDCRDVHNQNTKITGYPTEKPPLLLRRIIEASSNRGDLVLDCYAGSGTTLDVSSELDRRWIGMDNSMQAIATTLHRFHHGLRPMGDYVTMRNQASNDDMIASQKQATQLALELVLPAAEPERHEPLRDFTLYAEQSMTHELTDNVIAKLWTD